MGIKGWAIRAILGLVLGAGATFVVEVLHLALIVLIFGGLDEYLNRKHPREEARLHILGLFTMFGAGLATAVASFLGVMLAPTHYPDRLVLRSWPMAATLGALVGAGIGGLASLLHPRYLELDLTVVLVLACGVLAGTAAALLLRLRVNR